ncbi:MAG: CofH family radical SAM protein [Dehalococcoidia bacterium]|nr:CofH family radical SAM protein [Dehalococcoidia bacterium]
MASRAGSAGVDLPLNLLKQSEREFKTPAPKRHADRSETQARRMTDMLSQIRNKVEAGERITPEEGLFLLSKADLLDLAPLAQTWRWRHNPAPHVSFVVDTNLNYTNICDAYCSFCAFYRTDPSDPSAYTYTVEQIMEKIGKSVEKGVTTVLMQGGLNDALPLSYYVEMVRETKRRFPTVTPHYWSAPEIMKMSQVSGESVHYVLQALWDAGQRTMPGGGSEILSNRAKAIISRFKPKDTVDQWTQVHVEAHKIGFVTTATMMYGHVETDEEIVESLDHIRKVEDQAKGGPGGFTAFIPWSYKRSNTALAKKVLEEAGPNKYLRIIALSRIYLDNVPHIQASWFSEGRKTGQVALQFGADDFGGTLFDENVMLAAGFYNRTTIDEAKSLISEAGFIPSQRTTSYRILEVFEKDAPIKPLAVPVSAG